MLSVANYGFRNMISFLHECIAAMAVVIASIFR